MNGHKRQVTKLQAINDEEEEVVTLSDVIQHNDQMTEAANAVLGDASDTHCSYPMGYMRQAVFACMTCTPDARENPQTRAGVCLACTYHCHQDHELVELYTKRAFRCDCGNETFLPNHPCHLEANKTSRNARNTYSQNYGGLYCQCHRPYPDPERTTPEVMVQCIICEDWLHEEHIFENLDQNVECSPKIVPESFEEFICLACMKEHPFLMAYTVQTSEENGVDDQSSILSTDVIDCRLHFKQRQLKDKGLTTVVPTFWSSDWRKELCECSSCVSLFEKHKIAFLLDPDDALHVYEASARARTSASGEEMAQRAFATKLTHEQQVEVAKGYSRMKQTLQQYLAGFAAAGKTVKKEDIQTFFQKLNQAKRQKIE
ncbi:hypothetical protein CCR75_003454 [Bremia lactucae]|uniref:UBR-type domain-containing protein n=1 Tax=Bremia lactucae TaxID=4779 RepID=A0A976FJF8_BRELC|nr:hypothetical protein CCR75_003454 [Bremia lactucae]